jgi:hypothetical protein
MYPSPLLPLGAVVLLILLLVYVGFPVAVRLTLKQPAQPPLIPFPLDRPGLPPEAAEQFRIVIDELRPAGFEPVTGLAMPNPTSDVKQLVLFLVNRPAKDYGYATLTYSGVSKAGAPAARPHWEFWVEFVSHFRCGRRLRTNNSGTDLGAVVPGIRRTISQFPQVRDAGRLYRLHQALVARSGLGEKVFRLDEEFQGNAAAAVAAFMGEAFAEGVRPGYMYLSPEDKVYRLTWKGAFLMTWKLMWPLKAFRRAVRDRRARRLLAELEDRRGGSV